MQSAVAPLLPVVASVSVDPQLMVSYRNVSASIPSEEDFPDL